MSPLLLKWKLHEDKDVSLGIRHPQDLAQCPVHETFIGKKNDRINTGLQRGTSTSLLHSAFLVSSQNTYKGPVMA